MLTCPRCDELCPDGATTCWCGARLLPTEGDRLTALHVGLRERFEQEAREFWLADNDQHSRKVVPLRRVK